MATTMENRCPFPGILAMEVYFPVQYVSQPELEVSNGVSEGKYTVGLGQLEMGFCSSNEDAISMALTVTRRLLNRTGTSPAKIGRLEVGTESGLDRSKPVKSYLMQLFTENPNILGTDCVQACFGGTQALFNAADWLTSTYWDGRYAIVVASDVAVYPSGPARPTGGVGAVAMLLGPNAPIVFEPHRAVYAEHVFDFYKPNPASEYALVDGAASVKCYLTALKACYHSFSSVKGSCAINWQDVCAILFHAPYCRLVEKGFSRLVLDDAMLNCGRSGLISNSLEAEQLQQFISSNPDACSDVTVTLPDMLKLTRSTFERLTLPSLRIAQHVGNMYTASLYGCLASFLAHDAGTAIGPSQILLFSYGSGLQAAMFSLRLRRDCISSLQNDLRIELDKRFSRRRQFSPAKFAAAMDLRSECYGRAPLHPKDEGSVAEDGVFYLVEIDDRFRRIYACQQLTNGNGCNGGEHI